MKRSELRQLIRFLMAELHGAANTADQLALLRQLNAAREELTQLEALWKLSCPDVSVPSLEGAEIERLLDRTVQRERADFGCVQLWDRPTGRLALLAQTNFDRSFVRDFAVLGEEDGTICSAAARMRRIVTVTDLADDDLFLRLKTWGETIGIRSAISVPILRQDRLLGVYSLHYRHVHHIGREEGSRLPDHASRFGNLIAAIGA